MEALIHPQTYSSTDAAIFKVFMGLSGLKKAPSNPLNFKYTSEFASGIKTLEETEATQAFMLLSQSAFEEVWADEPIDWNKYEAWEPEEIQTTYPQRTLKAC